MECALFRFLEQNKKGKRYIGKIQEMTPIIENWLSYVANTFPHYPCHTLAHSKNILEQISLLLFKNPESSRPQPVIHLSAVEAYVLICASYLHDAGMVVSDTEKEKILGSDEWKAFVHNGGGKNEYQKLKRYEDSIKGKDTSGKEYYAYWRALRFIIADYARRQHHRLSGSLIEMHCIDFGQFDFGDHSLKSTISNVCVAHGLNYSELLDSDRYPDDRTIHGESINVRMMAMLLRLGDLLDIGPDRACHALIMAANPIPQSSKVHWDQYKRISHRLTRPGLIEITALCEKQEEHRTLKDWCSWIEEECNNGMRFVQLMSRHSEWPVPQVKIKILPSATASYIFTEWKFEIDEERVVNHLINSVHRSKYGFIIELLQNALDATRCRMYCALKSKGKKPPNNPWKIQKSIRDRYPITINLESVQSLNGNPDDVQTVITIQDSGIGMSSEVIKNYLLQVGRSYYTTQDFIKNYSFQPISRFGIGFMSVFAMSDHVEIETHKESYDALRIKLTGPRNYLLIEKVDNCDVGTTVKVYLRDSCHVDSIVSHIKNSCPYVEFPINISCGDNITTVTAETYESFCFNAPDLSVPGNMFWLKSYPISTDSMHGFLYTLVYNNSKFDDFSMLGYAQYDYPKRSPRPLPKLPYTVISYNGLLGASSGNYSYVDSNKFARVDYRGAAAGISLEKNLDGLSGSPNDVISQVEKQLDAKWVKILSEHLSEASSSMPKSTFWSYLQRLPKYYPIISFWERQDYAIKLHTKESLLYINIAKANDIDYLTTYSLRKQSDLSPNDKHWMIDNGGHSLFYRTKLFECRVPVEVDLTCDKCVRIVWGIRAPHISDKFIDFATKYGTIGSEKTMYACSHIDCGWIMRPLFKINSEISSSIVLNLSHPFINWLVNLAVITNDPKSISQEIRTAIINLYHHHLQNTILSAYGFDKDAHDGLVNYISSLIAMKGFPSSASNPPIQTVHPARNFTDYEFHKLLNHS